MFVIRAARWIFVGLIWAGMAMDISAAKPSGAMNANHTSPLELRSSDPALDRAFAWAKAQALSYVRDSDPVGPWYEAALPGRDAFCMRDVSHQASGGEVLGLSEHTFNMLHKFASNIAESRDWCTYWEIDRLNRPAPVDYESDRKFWYTLPANFDVLDACYRMYRWTGDRRYIDDPAMLSFYRHTMVEYRAKWQIDPEHIMTRHIEVEGSRGIPSYVETEGGFSIGVDVLASAAAACRSYSAILDLRGERSMAARYRSEMAKYLHMLDSKWWNERDRKFYGFHMDDGSMANGNRWFMLHWDAVTDPIKLRASIEEIAAIPLDQNAFQVEDKSYYPEILFRYGLAGKATAQILDLAMPGRYRREYPEVSYALIGAMATGLMGISCETGRSGTAVMQTLSGLPDDTSWAEMDHVPIQGTSIRIRHDGHVKTTIANLGHRAVRWRATFLGRFDRLEVNGRLRKARREVTPNGDAASSVEILLRPGDRFTSSISVTSIAH